MFPQVHKTFRRFLGTRPAPNERGGGTNETSLMARSVLSARTPSQLYELYAAHLGENSLILACGIPLLRRWLSAPEQLGHNNARTNELGVLAR
jgi:hypothetical protein